MLGKADYDSQEASRRLTLSPGTPRARRPALSDKDCQWRRGVVGSRTWLHLGPARLPEWGRGAGAQGCKSRPVMAPACSLRSPAGVSGRPRLALTLAPEIPCKLRDPNAAKARELQGGLPASALRRGISSALHHPLGHKELLLVLKICLKRDSLPGLRTGKGWDSSVFIYSLRLCSRVYSRLLERKLMKSRGVGADNPIEARFVLSATKQFYSNPSPPLFYFFCFSTFISS